MTAAAPPSSPNRADQADRTDRAGSHDPAAVEPARRPAARFERGIGAWLVERGARVGLARAAIGVVVLGVVLRLSMLGSRPLHHDESLDAWFSWQVLTGTFDGYDPVYHGPLRFHLTAALFWLLGSSATVARLSAALAGAAVVALIWRWRDDLGAVGTVVAMGLAAVSPTLLYFARFGREDSLFLALTAATVSVLIDFVRRPRPWQPMVLGALLVTGLAVKEAVFITIFVLGSLGGVLVAQELLLAPTPTRSRRRGRPRPASDDRAGRGRGEAPPGRDPATVRRVVLGCGLGMMLAAFAAGGSLSTTVVGCGLALAVLLVVAGRDATRRRVDLARVPIVRSFAAVPASWWLGAAAVAVGLFVLFFSQFLTDFSGPGTASAPYGALENGLRAGIEYWNDPSAGLRGDTRWWYYLVLLSAYEWLAIGLAAVGVVRVLRSPTVWGQTMVWWAGSSLIVYSWAGERMPWLAIHPLLPIVVLAGLGAQGLWSRRWSRWRIPVAAALAVAVGATVVTSVGASLVRPSEPRELLVQAGQSTPEVPVWVERVARANRLRAAEDGRLLTVAIDAELAWPYGWYLRELPDQVAYIDLDGDQPDADIIILAREERDPEPRRLAGYTTAHYDHRWSWTPDFATGLGSWLRWLVVREPWTGAGGEVGGDRDGCPRSVVAEVFVRDDLVRLLERYGDDPTAFATGSTAAEAPVGSSSC